MSPGRDCGGGGTGCTSGEDPTVQDLVATQPGLLRVQVLDYGGATQRVVLTLADEDRSGNGPSETIMHQPQGTCPGSTYTTHIFLETATRPTYTPAAGRTCSPFVCTYSGPFRPRPGTPPAGSTMTYTGTLDTTTKGLRGSVTETVELLDDVDN